MLYKGSHIISSRVEDRLVVLVIPRGLVLAVGHAVCHVENPYSAQDKAHHGAAKTAVGKGVGANAESRVVVKATGSR